MGLFSRRAETVSRSEVGPTLNFTDPALAEYLGLGGGHTAAGAHVSERTALGVTAVYRSVSIIATTLADLPLKSYRTDPTTDERSQVSSLLDDPCPQHYTPYEWKSLVFTWMALHGAAPLQHLYGGAGQLVGLFPVHPTHVTVRWSDPDPADFSRHREFVISGAKDKGSSSNPYTDADFTYIMGLSIDGLHGLSPIITCRNAIGTALAGDKAAARMFVNGLLVGGLVSAEGMSKADGQEAIASLKARMAGADNAGDLVMMNAALKVQPWTQTAADGQFIESRQHQITEIARIWGMPKVLLAEDGASTWGSGIAELLRGMAKFTFRGFTTPVEERLSELLYGSTRHVEFDYAGLLAGTPEEEIQLLIQQVQAGILTNEEARAIRNLPPLPAALDPSPAPGQVAQPPLGAAGQPPATTTEGA